MADVVRGDLLVTGDIKATKCGFLTNTVFKNSVTNAEIASIKPNEMTSHKADKCLFVIFMSLSC